VERGFASATLGTGVLEKFQPAKRAAAKREPKRMLVDVLSESIAGARFAGFNHLLRSRS
jgi:hypothetical protein